MNKTTIAFAIACSLGLPGELLAHHSSAPHFDRNNVVEVDGTFTKLAFVNPHAYIYFDVEQDGETANWRCELSSATQMTRNGWTQDFLTPGDKINVTGAMARREENVCYLNSFTLADGTSIQRNQDVSNLNNSATAVAEATALAAESRPAYLDNGQPNLGGPWVSRSFGRGAMGTQPSYQATAAGEAAAEGYDMAFDDPILRCHFVNIFNGWNHDTNVNDIYQTEDAVTLQYGFMDLVRTVHLNMSEHPENIEPSSAGHSIGWWEEDTLVVDTIGFTEGVLSHRTGMKHSDQMHAVERFYVDPDSQMLVRDYTVTDPLYLVGTVTGQDVQAIASTPYQTYNCVELSGKNNIRPEDLPAEEAELEPVAEPNAPATPAVKPWWKFWD